MFTATFLCLFYQLSHCPTEVLIQPILELVLDFRPVTITQFRIRWCTELYKEVSNHVTKYLLKYQPSFAKYSLLQCTLIQSDRLCNKSVIYVCKFTVDDIRHCHTTRVLDMRSDDHQVNFDLCYISLVFWFIKTHIWDLNSFQNKLWLTIVLSEQITCNYILKNYEFDVD